MAKIKQPSSEMLFGVFRAGTHYRPDQKQWPSLPEFPPAHESKLYRFDTAIMFSSTGFVYARSEAEAYFRLFNRPECVELESYEHRDSFLWLPRSVAVAGTEAERRLRAKKVRYTGKGRIRLEGAR